MSLKLSLALAGSMLAALTASAGAQALHVVELFTSQGCSSCPPADAVLAKLAARGDVLALGYHVDYWDRLGWKDTLGDAAFTARQRGYAAGRGDARIYTPQAVVNGRGHAIGSDSGAVARLMRAKMPVDVSIEGEAGEVSVGAGEGSGTVWRVDYTRRSAVPIARGENRGRTVTYVNAVRGMTPLGRWSGKAARFRLGTCGAAKGADTCAVLLQSGEAARPGAILGAAAR